LEKAMEDEHDSLLENNTWILVPEDEIPPDHQILEMGIQNQDLKRSPKPPK
jgi:hypothetical protein